MKNIFLNAFLIWSSLFIGVKATNAQEKKKTIEYQRLTFDKGWKFYLGDIPFPEIKTHNDTYNNAKAGKAWGAAAPEYNDREWRSLNLPHDWVIEGEYDSTENIGQSYRKRGYGWYRRQFKLDSSDRGKHLEIQFDGIATHATVWVNGTLVHRNWCGYTSFYIDISALAQYGDNLNTIAIRVDANPMEGWWYEGAGIYRHAWLVKRAPVHIITDGVFAHPVKDDKGSWTLPVEVTLENSGKEEAPVEVEVSLIDKAGKLINRSTVKSTVEILRTSVVNLTIPVENPELWSVDHPVLYKVITKVKKNNQISDTLLTKCGFRTIRFDKDNGFFLNDKPVKIQGVCNHQDHAGVGVAVPDALWEFRLRKLKEMGVNGYRCAHNPPASEFLDACDSLGMLVMDENRNFNSSPEYVRQLEWMIKRDRNHPSIILWSVFNEEPMQGTETGYEMVRRMYDIVKKLDSTRPVTAAMNGGFFAPVNVSQVVDVVGFNYQDDAYDRFHKENPEMKLTSSEDVSAYQVRGEYRTDKSRNIFDSYDSESTPWGKTHRAGWKLIDERPFLAGAFVWTGFDYHGEPTPFAWPSVSSFFGILDLCGFPKMAYYLHKAQWVKNQPVLHLVPHWNFPADSMGKNIKVMALSNADSVTILLNGKLISGQKVDKYEMNTWQVPYQPGRLEAIGYKNGKEYSRYSIETTGEPVQLQLIPDRNTLLGDGRDAMPVTVQAIDSKGRAVATANLPVEFSITENSEILGTGNGNPNSHESEIANKRNLFNGLAQVIIRGKEQTSGKIILTATSPGLKSAHATIKIKKVNPIPFVEIVKPVVVLDKWLVSPISAVRPNPNQKIAHNDMNSWSPVSSGAMMQTMDKKAFILYRTSFEQYESEKESGYILIKNVKGKAEVWLDDKMIALKPNSATKDINILLPSGKGRKQLTIMIISELGEEAGLGGTITYEDN